MQVSFSREHEAFPFIVHKFYLEGSRDKFHSLCASAGSQLSFGIFLVCIWQKQIPFITQFRADADEGDR